MGGLGDILVHRMMFEDFKRVMPDVKLIFACPKIYRDAVKDHPYLDDVLDCKEVDTSEYIQVYNTSNACCRYELAKAPFSGKNRCDIWANHCGVVLKNHNMHLNLEETIKKEAMELVEKHRTCNGPKVLFTPISAMLNKNLTMKQTKEVILGLRERGLYVYTSHLHHTELFDHMNVPVLKGNIRQWMGFVYAADCVVSVDTAAFHMAGGIGKPLVGIFSFTDGKVYSKYYKAELVQKHRDNGDWDCGPCYNWLICPKSKSNPKPCITEITSNMILEGVDKMLATFRLN